MGAFHALAVECVRDYFLNQNEFFMITVNEAEAKIISHTRRGGIEKVPLSLAWGRILREMVVADRAFPPFDRVALDGIAIYLNASGIPRDAYLIQEIVGAGVAPPALQSEDRCLEVMTGAVLPPGTNCVIPYENLNLRQNLTTKEPSRVAVPKVGQFLSLYENVHRRGEDADEGACLVKKGARIDCHVSGVAATVGKEQILCSRLPRIAIVSTGTELVPVSETPLPHQIRRSNVHSIAAALSLHGFDSASLHHLEDDPRKIRRAIAYLLERNDYLIFTGGVSKGRFDFVPEALEQCGVTKIFHGIAQKPGKPMWFGKILGGCLVFGLPGNPMSALVCLHRYVLPSLGVFTGHRDAFSSSWKIQPDPELKRDKRTRFVPASLYQDEQGRLRSLIKEHHGSGDLASLVGTHGFLEIPAESEHSRVWPFWSWQFTPPTVPLSRPTCNRRDSYGVHAP